MTSRAKSLRRTPTPAEIRLWRLLYPYRTNGFHWRKQAPIGTYIVDFACHHAKLIIEVDGDSHFTTAGIAADKSRSAFLQASGYHILRFTNDDVMNNSDGVAAFLAIQLTNSVTSTAPTPSPLRGGLGRGAFHSAQVLKNDP